MPRYFLEIAYDGTNYHGWQIQENGHSVQAEIEKNLSQLFSNKTIEVTGCGRTDTGVHARQFYLHFDTDHPVLNGEEIVFKLNRMLPGDISVYSFLPVHESAHARFDAESRTYQYLINRKKNPFLLNKSWWSNIPLDVHAMNFAAEKMKSYSDFAAFCKSGAASKTTLCKITEAYWNESENQLVFQITADRFLRNMVRAVVGTLILVGKKIITVDEFCAIIESKNRSSAGESVPAHGLYLTKISYPYIRSIDR